jgi:MmgE/PrpD C-terminal domain
VEVGTFELGKKVMAGDAEKWHPATRETADHSMPYVVACALARGTVNREDLDESRSGHWTRPAPRKPCSPGPPQATPSLGPPVRPAARPRGYAANE